MKTITNQAQHRELGIEQPKAQSKRANDNGSSQVYHELHAVIWRYMNEAPDMKAFEMIGALEAVKADVMDTLKRHNERTSEEA